MPKTQSARPSLPASSSDFALPTSSSLNSLQNSSVDDFNPLLFRFRRPSLLAPQYLSDRIGSPLASSFTLAMPRPSSEFEIDRTENMWTDSSPSSSENATPPLQGSGNERDIGPDIDTNMQTSRPQTPPRPSSSSNMGIASTDSVYQTHIRRLSHPPKIPRILNLLSESKLDENEVKSEAQFQRLVASFSELPTQPRTPRAPSDRGRYPEEAGEDNQREDTPSDDGDDDDNFSFAPPPASEPINISKPRTPVPSASGSMNGDDLALDSPVCGTAMDIDMPSSTYGSPSVPMGAHQWRYTPPPTASAVRTNKRKYDDRFDPYPTASKRRAVSPSISYLRETHSSLSPIYIPRSSSNSRPISIPIANSNANSVTSSPTIGSSGLTISRPSFGSASVASSPTLRASMSLASPIARPLRLNGRKGETEDKEIDGAGEGVGGLRL